MLVRCLKYNGLMLCVNKPLTYTNKSLKFHSTQAEGLSPSQITSALTVPGVTINATTVTDGTTYTAANGAIITVNKPPGSPYATSITTTVNGQTVTLPFVNPSNPTVVNGKKL